MSKIKLTSACAEDQTTFQQCTDHVLLHHAQLTIAKLYNTRGDSQAISMLAPSSKYTIYLVLVQWIRDDINKIFLKRIIFFLIIHIVLNDFLDKITPEIGLYSEGDDSMRL